MDWPHSLTDTRIKIEDIKICLCTVIGVELRKKFDKPNIWFSEYKKNNLKNWLHNLATPDGDLL